MPQLWKNWRRKSSESLSGAFLANWLLGDICNLVGCLLTGQLAFQTRLAMYFVFADTLLLTQYLYYLRAHNARLRRREELFIPLPQSTTSLLAPDDKHLVGSPSRGTSAANWMPTPNSEAGSSEDSPLLTPPSASGASSSAKLFAIVLFALPMFANAPPVSSYTHGQTHGMSSDRAFSVGAAAVPATLAQSIGVVVAWTCTALYLSSRLPQIYHNVVRGSCRGLSISMFFCAAMGNLTYVLSILATSTEHAAIVSAAPYLLGSGGTLGFDAVIFLQWFWYGRGRALLYPLSSQPLHMHHKERDSDDEEGATEFMAVKSTDSLV
ncbi:hypothetical protein HDU87_001013 [Geranomyces variabilis]|uniref:PQ loop repeat protein n=1 Tax=Geranomyces variabilis TaxID=109894 RepID=A0AAD5TNL0_9FUNG|nr:hypothetical protein HDU87_001013 [Geranomyces variabilis]